MNHIQTELAASPLPLLDGPEAVAEQLVLLVHRGVDWDVWGGRRHLRYWDALADRVRAATYAGPTVTDWWERIEAEMDSQPRSPADRAVAAALIASVDQRAVLAALRKHAATLVLRVRVYVEHARERAALATAEEATAS